MDIRQTFIKNLKAELKKRDIPIKAITMDMGLHKGSIYRWFAPKLVYMPTWPKYQKLCETLGVDYGYLLREEE